MPRYAGGDLIPTFRSGGVPATPHILNDCCITATAWECLSDLYCQGGEMLWAVEPCTPLASIACRDESQLRAGIYRFAHSVWVAVGDEKEPKRLIGLINFRPIGDTDKTYKEWECWNLGCAEAFLCVPPDWTPDDVPLLEDRYIRALTPALRPRGRKAFLRDVEIRPRISTVPYAAQWSVSGTCAQTSAFMLALQLCLPDRGHTIVEGPFSISCFAEDIKRQLGIPQLKAVQDKPLDPISLHRKHFGRYDWSGATPRNLFEIQQGADLRTLSETLRRFLADPEPQPGTGGRPRMSPAYITSRDEPVDRRFSLPEFRRTLNSALVNGYPVMVQTDLELARAASIVASPPHKHAGDIRDDCRALLNQAGKIILDGKIPSKPPTKWASDPNVDFNPLEQIHCVVVIGGKRLLSDADDGMVLFHDPWYGPYRQACIKDFYVAANLPYMLFVGPKGDFLANGDGKPVIDLVVPVPHAIGFDLHELTRWDFVKYERIVDRRQREDLRALIKNPSEDEDVEWRVRVLPKSRVWDSYFAGFSTLDKEDVDMASLLPKEEPDSGHVLCIETFGTSCDALNQRPQTVIFAYMPPREPETAGTITNPKAPPRPTFTGGFGVDRSEEGTEVVFFRISPDGIPIPLSSALIRRDVIATGAL